MLRSWKNVLMGATALALPAFIMSAQAADPVADYTLETVIAQSAFHGIHGLTFTSDNKLLAGSVLGRAIYEIDVEGKTVSTYIGAPMGMADDLEEGPNGELGWTAFLEGKYYLRTKDGETRTLAEGLPGLNSTAWSPDGRLFATQVFLADALYELDPSGANPPRKIMEGMGGLNGFDFGPDGKLYGPLWFKGTIVRVDVDTGEMETVAEGFKVPAAVNFDSKGNLWAVDTAAGHVVHVNVSTGETSVVARVAPSIDNLAFDANDQLFISNMADNAIIHINTQTGEAHPIVKGELAVAADIAHGHNAEGEEIIFIGDLFSFRTLNVATGKISEIGRVFGANIDYPISVGINGDQIALSGWSAGMVQTYDISTGSLGDIHHNFTTPTDALPLPGGDVLVAEFARGALVRVDGADWSKRTDVATELAGPTSLLAGKDGKILVSENLSGTISEVDLVSGERTILASGLEGPEGFDQAEDGTLYVAEVGAKSISRIAPDGTRHIIGSDLPIGFAGPDDGLPVYVPTGVVLSDNGDVYFTADEVAGLYRLTQHAENR